MTAPKITIGTTTGVARRGWVAASSLGVHTRKAHYVREGRTLCRQYRHESDSGFLPREPWTDFQCQGCARRVFTDG